MGVDEMDVPKIVADDQSAGGGGEQQAEPEEHGRAAADVPPLSLDAADALIEDEELCDNCRWRELHLAAVADQHRKGQEREGRERDAMRKYYQYQSELLTKETTEQRARDRRLRDEVNAINKHMVEEKRKQAGGDEPNGWLMYKRPDTSSASKTKQRHLQAELDRQMNLKLASTRRERDAEREASSGQAAAISEQMAKQRAEARATDQRKKLQYRLALQQQMEQGTHRLEDGEPWWSRRPPTWLTAGRPTHSVIDPQVAKTDDQAVRVAKQDTALRNLESYLEQEQQDKETSRLAAVARRDQYLAEHPQTGREGATDGQSELRSQRVAAAWDEAKQRHQQQYDMLQNQQGGLAAQVCKYKECRRCHRAIKNYDNTPKPKSYWIDSNSGVASVNETSRNMLSRHM